MNELAKPFSISLLAISATEGARARGRCPQPEAQWPPSRLQPNPLDDAMEWMQARKQTWEARMDRLDAHLRRRGESDHRPDLRAPTAQVVLITRVFEAPLELRLPRLDRACRARRVVRPRAVRPPREKVHIDLRVGGRYELTMVHRDSGAEFAIGYEIVELAEP